MKTIKLADFKVKDLPSLKEVVDAVTPEDLALVNSIWTSNIEKCLEGEYEMSRMFLEGLPDEDGNYHMNHEEGKRIFAAFYALQRKTLQSMVYFSKDQRRSSFERLQWLHTKGEKAGFYPENLSYLVPINIIDKETGLFDLNINKNDKVTEYETENSDVKARKGKRKVSFTYEFWQLESELIVPTIHNIPKDLEVLISSRTGKKTSLQALIEEAGGLAYKGAMWLRKNPGATVEDAVTESIKQMMKEMKKEGMDYEVVIKRLAKSFHKLPIETIRETVAENWDKYGDKFSLEKCTTQLKRKNSRNRPCTVWDEYTDKLEFPSTEMAAKTLGYARATIQQAINTGNALGNGLYVTRKGKKPKALKPMFDLLTHLRNLADTMHITMKDKIAPVEENIYWDYFKYNNLAKLSEIYNLKQSTIKMTIDKFVLIHDKEAGLGRRNASTTPPEVEPVQTNSTNRSEKINEQFGLQGVEDEFKPCPDRRISSYPSSTTGNSDGVATLEDEVEDLVVT